jgi:ectoine hydroxylase-related dioxygenase (phytanoyl-CoA dioxygenase family)
MTRTVITDEQAQFFHDNGYLIVQGVLQGNELTHIQAAMDKLTDYGKAEVRKEVDFAYQPGHKTGKPILQRIEYVIDKTDEGKVLLGNPFILRSVEKLMGKDLFPTWDSMVLKLPGEGIQVYWHRDAGVECVGDMPIFNVDFYLDTADEDTCVWVIPGSHKWPQDKVDAVIRQDGFRKDGMIPAIMKPGDVMFHDILVVHGSTPNESSKLRRVLYYEFRTAHVEAALGPHVPEYIPLKQQVLCECIARRKAAPYIAPGEVPYDYQPPAPWDTFGAGATLESFRYAHGDYWRS